MILSAEEIEKRISDSYELPNKVLEKVTQPIVSVRTSTYNHGPYIKQCIEGVLMQKTNFQIEYIIGEDFSTDETRAIVFEYAKKYPHIIRVITADYNVGSKANGRRCIRACRGKYMAICEGDDYWTDPLKLQKQVDFLEGHPEYGMCYTKVQYYYQSEKKMGQIWGGNYTTFEKLFQRNTIPTLTVLLRNKLYKDYCHNIQPALRNWKMGDYPMWLWFAHESLIAFIPEITGVYRVLNESASHSASIEKFISFSLSGEAIREFYNEYFQLGISNNEFVYRRWCIALRSYAIFSEWEKMTQTWLEGIILTPSYLFRLSTYKYFLFAFSSKLQLTRK